jgi:predicted DsbA family dithiol-disulfide isomerase
MLMNKVEPLSIRQVAIKVEIWADIVCPWCYIGKRRFEKALGQFEQKKNIIVEWKSYQLDPNRKTEPGKNVNQMLAEKKGWSLDYAKKMNNNVTDLAMQEGLIYNFNKAVVANTFDAHRLIQLAKKRGLGEAAEERLFRAYFTEGHNIADHQTLIQLGTSIGLDPVAVTKMLAGNECAEDVNRDIYEARNMGVQGVPHFIINNKYRVSGAQQPETFLSALKTIWENEKSNSALS